MSKMKHFLGFVGQHQKQRILLVGAGGTGSQLITGLARINKSLIALGHPGIHLIVCDGDTVSTSNVGRQLFSEADIGRNKAVVLVNRVNMFFGTNWQAVPANIEMVDVREAPELVISAVDSVKARRTIFNSVNKAKDTHYWLDTGNTRSTGQVILGTLKPIKQPDAGCVEYLPNVLNLYPDMVKEEAKAYQGPSCSVEDAIRRQDLFINQWVATCALEILWKCFRKGSLEVHGAFVDVDSFKVRPLPIDPDVWRVMGWHKPKKRERKRKKNS